MPWLADKALRRGGTLRPARKRRGPERDGQSVPRRNRAPHRPSGQCGAARHIYRTPIDLRAYVPTHHQKSGPGAKQAGEQNSAGLIGACEGELRAPFRSGALFHRILRLVGRGLCINTHKNGS